MLKADMEDRNGGPPHYSAWREYAIIAFIIGLFVAGGAFFYWGKDMLPALQQLTQNTPAALPETAPDPLLAKLYERYEMEALPATLVKKVPISGYITKLQREPCDWNVTYDFAVALQKAGYSRDTAKVFQAYSNKCRPSDVALYNAADALYGLSDFDGALKVMDDLLVMSPDLAQSYYLKAQILSDAKRHKEAINAYESTIGLSDDLTSMSGEVFRQISLSYAALGDYCGAITPIQTWISIDPAKNDTVRSQTMLKDYTSKGKCEQRYATGNDRFPSRGKDVITAKVSINGVPGNFIVDTGASFVSISRDFAARIKLPLTEDYSVRMQTANGVSWAQRSSASKVKIGKVEANDVAMIVMADEKALGSEIDGLLGRSFLSRFNVIFGADAWEIQSKQ
ncbi:TIGR02281 family clan AA aspartic protease [Phyllobacterium sp. YR531]|uniref:TIGR02281 family clan AA aspartic protease n=1 Tax=Phyllobacterium sp. YR531 TaxID=1144343 RepID=UPI00026FCC5F|nr:TIGR02281 family clan AA aspartic protease [Phyllobacterium sp. YR531]EJN02410.1 clan AA aspartic protease, TIGR02281 family [Phyllobacterium sp. YR531]